MLRAILRPFIAPLARRKLAGLEAKQAALQAAIDRARANHRRVAGLHAAAQDNTMKRLHWGQWVKR